MNTFRSPLIQRTCSPWLRNRANSQPSVPLAVSAQNANNNGHKQSATIDSQESAADDQLGTPQAVDFDSLLARVENDTNLAEELVELYLDSSRRVFRKLKAALSSRTPLPCVQRPTRSKAHCKT